MIVDSHVNLHGEKFAEDLDETIARAREAGVGSMLNICCHINDFEAVLKVANKDPNIWATVGTHPHDAKDNPDITAEEIIALTHVYFSVSGIMTFKNADDVRDRIKTMPRDRIMLETDCPYLAPMPYRGRRNEPAYVVEVCKALAELFDWTLEETEQKTTDAFFNLFTKAQRPS